MRNKTEQEKKLELKNRAEINAKILNAITPKNWIEPRKFITNGNVTQYRDAYLFTIKKVMTTYLKESYLITVSTLTCKQVRVKELGMTASMGEAKEIILAYNNKFMYQREESMR